MCVKRLPLLPSLSESPPWHPSTLDGCMPPRRMPARLWTRQAAAVVLLYLASSATASADPQPTPGIPQLPGLAAFSSASTQCADAQALQASASSAHDSSGGPCPPGTRVAPLAQHQGSPVSVRRALADVSPAQTMAAPAPSPGAPSAGLRYSTCSMQSTQHWSLPALRVSSWPAGLSAHEIAMRRTMCEFPRRCKGL